MAARGFIELLRLADEARKKQDGNQQIHEDCWSGLTFTVAGFFFVAPLGEVAGVIPQPSNTLIPNAKPWLIGIANVRGRLLLLTDLLGFLTGQNSRACAAEHKVIIANDPSSYNGFVAEQVYGIEHFNNQNYVSSHDQLPKTIARYTQGYFEQDNRQWHVFMFSRLMQDPDFLNASV